jgi:hypothetical protein
VGKSLIFGCDLIRAVSRTRLNGRAVGAPKLCFWQLIDQVQRGASEID